MICRDKEGTELTADESRSHCENDIHSDQPFEYQREDLRWEREKMGGGHPGWLQLAATDAHDTRNSKSRSFWHSRRNGRNAITMMPSAAAYPTKHDIWRPVVAVQGVVDAS